MHIRLYIVLDQGEQHMFACINTEAACGQLTSEIVMKAFWLSLSHCPTSTSSIFQQATWGKKGYIVPELLVSSQPMLLRLQDSPVWSNLWSTLLSHRIWQSLLLDALPTFREQRLLSGTCWAATGSTASPACRWPLLDNSIVSAKRIHSLLTQHPLYFIFSYPPTTVLRAVKAHRDTGFKVFLSGFQNFPIENSMCLCYLGL